MSEEIIPQIENFFSEIEGSIKLRLQDKNQNQSDIKQKFKEGKELIDKLEGYDDEQHKLFRYKYHTTYTNYLEIDGDQDDIKLQEMLANKYEKLIKKPTKNNIDTYKMKSKLFTKTTLVDEIHETSEHIKEALEEELKNIQDILDDNVIKSIRQIFKQLDKIPKTFEDYKEIVANETILHKLADNTLHESLINLGESNTNDQSEQFESEQSEQSDGQNSKINKDKKQKIFSLEDLKSLAGEAAYLKRLVFIFHVLNSPNKKEILFSNVLFTEEEINKRFKDVALCFHSDKTNRPNTPTWLCNKHKNLGIEIFNFALEFKESLLDDLKELSKVDGCMTFHEKKANNLWKIAIDYRSAVNKQWNKLNLLKRVDVEDLSFDELKWLSIDNGMLAYQEYRAACKIADKAKQLKKQVKLRGNMALCLYISKKFIEAQLYALSAIQLQLRNSQKVTQQELNEAKKIFDKVKNTDDTTDSTEKPSKLKTEIKLNTNVNSTMALMRPMDQEISLFDKRVIEDSINKDVTKIGIELMIKADRSLVRYQTSKEVILHAKNRAFKHKIAGGTTVGGAVAMGGTAAIAGLVNIYEAVFIIGVGSISGPLALFGGIATLGLGIWGGKSLWKKGSLILKEPEIREKLNNIMVKALDAYDKGEYQKFIEIFSEEFNAGESLLKLKKHRNHIVPHNIIDTLLKHGFRSDGVAYLLNLLGEVLGSGKIKIEGKTTKDLKAMAMNVFDEALSETLEMEAKKLDERIRESQKNRRINYVNKFIDFVSLKEYSDVAQEHKDDSLKMPFKLRLEEMRNIARINQAIFDVIDAGEEEMERAIKTINEIRKSININHQIFNMAKWRYEVLEDLIWVISGDSPDGPELVAKLSLTTYVDNEYPSFLNKQLQQATSDKEKLHIYKKIAAYYEQLAEEEEKINRLNGLCHWKLAQNNYEKAREADPKNLDVALGFAKCLLKLFKYTQVIQLSKTCPDLTSLSEYWRFRSIAYCKQYNYEKAKENIIEALKLDNKNKLAVEQKSLLNKLSVENSIEWRINRYKKGINEIDCLKNSDSNKSPTYNILSIDGGGVCGVLPALWLSEIEHRTHRPISRLFNMMAGTSSGGIIAAGLSVPTWQKTYDEDVNPIYICSDSEPKFSASELLDIYQNQAKKLFVYNNSWSFFKPKYTNNDRISLLEECFGGVCLKNALTELIIPAVNEDNRTKTHLFTRYDARKHVLENYTFVNTLMATTAAPTFFPPHKIEDKGTFLDGALHINNPAMAAYETIQYNFEKENISVLSLGTGSYIPDPLNPDLYRDQLFWAQNLHKVVLPQQEGNTDNSMYGILGNRYRRWQVWLEEPIGLDDYKSIPNLLELGHQYIEELDASDDNPINKLVESLLERGL